MHIYSHMHITIQTCMYACMHACMHVRAGSREAIAFGRRPFASLSLQVFAGVLEVEVVLGAQGAAEGPAHGRSQRLSGQGGKAAERRGAGLPTGHAATLQRTSCSPPKRLPGRSSRACTRGGASLCFFSEKWRGGGGAVPALLVAWLLQVRGRGAAGGGSGRRGSAQNRGLRAETRTYGHAVSAQEFSELVDNLDALRSRGEDAPCSCFLLLFYPAFSVSPLGGPGRRSREARRVRPLPMPGLVHAGDCTST